MYKDPKVHTYDWVEYYDVWGNEEDGWDVNDLSKAETGLVIAEDATDEEVVEFIKRIGHLPEYANTDPSTETCVTVEWMDETICELTWMKDNYPIGRLEMERRDF